MDFKRGDTFSMSGTVTADVNGTTMTDFTGWSGRAQLRITANKLLISELTFTWLDISTGMMKLEDPLTTAGWALGDMSLDIEFDDGAGFIVSSATSIITVVEDITHD